MGSRDFESCKLSFEPGLEGLQVRVRRCRPYRDVALEVADEVTDRLSIAKRRLVSRALVEQALDQERLELGGEGPGAAIAPVEFKGELPWGQECRRYEGLAGKDLGEADFGVAELARARTQVEDFVRLGPGLKRGLEELVGGIVRPELGKIEPAVQGLLLRRLWSCRGPGVRSSGLLALATALPLDCPMVTLALDFGFASWHMPPWDLAQDHKRK